MIDHIDRPTVIAKRSNSILVMELGQGDHDLVPFRSGPVERESSDLHHDGGRLLLQHLLPLRWRRPHPTAAAGRPLHVGGRGRRRKQHAALLGDGGAATLQIGQPIRETEPGQSRRHQFS